MVASTVTSADAERTSTLAGSTLKAVSDGGAVSAAVRAAAAGTTMTPSETTKATTRTPAV
jgi:hypothetical protein